MFLTMECYTNRQHIETQNMKTFDAIEKWNEQKSSVSKIHLSSPSRLSKSERAIWACDLKATLIFVLKQSAMSWNCVFFCGCFFYFF
jgi:hypothetical protein